MRENSKRGWSICEGSLRTGERGGGGGGGGVEYLIGIRASGSVCGGGGQGQGMEDPGKNTSGNRWFK